MRRRDYVQWAAALRARPVLLDLFGCRVCGWSLQTAVVREAIRLKQRNIHLYEERYEFMQKLIWAGMLILCAGGRSSAQQNNTLSSVVREFVKVESPVVALNHVRVIDGTGSPAREDQTIIISGG